MTESIRTLKSLLKIPNILVFKSFQVCFHNKTNAGIFNDIQNNKLVKLFLLQFRKLT